MFEDEKLKNLLIYKIYATDAEMVEIGKVAVALLCVGGLCYGLYRLIQWMLS